MADQMEDLIKEIAVKHGVSVGRDDPILILQTLNSKLMEDNLKAQQVLLNQYKEELEGIALRWGNDAKDKSERILNASLKASKEAMVRQLEESVTNTTISVQKAIDEPLSRVSKALQDTKRVATFNLLASALTFMAASLAVIAIFCR